MAGKTCGYGEYQVQLSQKPFESSAAFEDNILFFPEV
jgi:hypothetical protein